MSYRKYSEDDPRYPTARAIGRLYDLIVQLRKDAQQCEDSKARILFITGAEILAGLARAYRSYEEEVTERRKHPSLDE